MSNVPIGSSPGDAAMRDGPRLGETSVFGYVDGIRNGILHGWAWDAKQPRRRVHLRVSLDGCVIQHVVARRFRADVEAAGFGDGSCGFELSVASLVPGAASVVLRVETADEGLELIGSPCHLNAATATLDHLVLSYEMWKLDLVQHIA